jgi:extracellular elastinolytic metalloproteinase
MNVDPVTYGNLPQLAIPHGVGYAWASMVWEVYWNLVAVHGFNPNIYGAWNTGGNNLALRLVIDGMKLQPCSPGFVDSRNAIIQADQNLTGGANKCPIWRGFAKRGLGVNASQGSSSSTTDGVQDFTVPSGC